MIVRDANEGARLASAFHPFQALAGWKDKRGFGGEPCWIRTSDLLINFPLRLSPPPLPEFVVWTFPSPYPVAGI